MKKITQREARRTRQRLAELEQRLVSDYPNGPRITTLSCSAPGPLAAMETARMLGRTLVVVPDGTTLKIFASKVKEN